MKSRPILFSAPMVLALLNGSKTQTRRIVKPQPDFETARKALGGDTSDAFIVVSESVFGGGIGLQLPNVDGYAVKNRTGFVQPNIHCQYGQPGDQLWVREAWRVGAMNDADPPRNIYQATAHVHYEADGDPDASFGFGKYRPPMFMPRWASRITLDVVSVRVERLQDISDAESVAEGCRALTITNPPMYESPKDVYRVLWEVINGAGSWAANPWVWVVEFKRVEQ